MLPRINKYILYDQLSSGNKKSCNNYAETAEMLVKRQTLLQVFLSYCLSVAKCTIGTAHTAKFLWCLEHQQRTQRDHKLMDKGKCQTAHFHFCQTTFSTNTFLNFFLLSQFVCSCLKSTGVLIEEKGNKSYHMLDARNRHWSCQPGRHTFNTRIHMVFQILPEKSLPSVLYQSKSD